MAKTDSAGMNNEMMEATSDDDSILSGYSVPDQSELIGYNRKDESLLTRSQYAMVVFHDIAESYPNDRDLVCHYTLTDGVQATPGDRVVLFLIGWTSLQDYVAFEWAPTPENGKRDLAVSFQALILPEDNEFYQVCYVSVGSAVCGASVPFQIRSSTNQKLTCAVDEDMVVVRSSTAVAQDHPRSNAVLRMEKKKLLKALEELENALANDEEGSAKTERDCARLSEIEEKLPWKDEKLNESRDMMAINVAETKWLATVMDEMAENKEKLFWAKQRVKELEKLAKAERKKKKKTTENYRAKRTVVDEKKKANEPKNKVAEREDKKTGNNTAKASEVEEKIEANETKDEVAEQENKRLENGIAETSEIKEKPEGKEVNDTKSEISEKEKTRLANDTARISEVKEKLEEINVNEARNEVSEMERPLKVIVESELSRAERKVKELGSAPVIDEREKKIREEEAAGTTESREKMALKEKELNEMELVHLQENYETSAVKYRLARAEQDVRRLENDLENAKLENERLEKSANASNKLAEENRGTLEAMVAQLEATNVKLLNDLRASQNITKVEEFALNQCEELEILQRLQLEKFYSEIEPDALSLRAKRALLEATNLKLLNQQKITENMMTEVAENARTRLHQFEPLNLGQSEELEISRCLSPEKEEHSEVEIERAKLQSKDARLGAKKLWLTKSPRNITSRRLLSEKQDSKIKAEREKLQAKVAQLETTNLKLLNQQKIMENMMTEVAENARTMAGQLESLKLAHSKELEASRRLLSERQDYSEVKAEREQLHAKVAQLEVTKLKLLNDLKTSHDMRVEVTERARTMGGLLESLKLAYSKELEASQRLLSERQDYSEVKAEREKLQAKVVELEATNQKLLNDLKTSQRLRAEREVCVIMEDCNGDKVAEELKNENLRLCETLEDTELIVATLEHEMHALKQLLDDTLDAQRNALTREEVLSDDAFLFPVLDLIDLEAGQNLDLALRSNVAEAEARAALELDNASLRNTLTNVTEKVDKLIMENQQLRLEIHDKSEGTSEENDGPTVQILMKELAERNKAMESLAMDIQKERSNFTLELEKLRLENEDLVVRINLLVQQKIKEGDANSEMQRLASMHKVLLDQNAELTEKLQKSENLQRELATTKEENESIKNTLKATQEQLNATREEMENTLSHMEREKDKRNSDAAEDCGLLAWAIHIDVIQNELRELGAKLGICSGEGKSANVYSSSLLKISEHLGRNRKGLSSADCSLDREMNLGAPSEAELKQRLERAAEEYEKVYLKMRYYKRKYANVLADIMSAKEAAAVRSEEEGEISEGMSEQEKEKITKEGVEKEPQESAAKSSEDGSRMKYLKYNIIIDKSSLAKKSTPYSAKAAMAEIPKPRFVPNEKKILSRAKRIAKNTNDALVDSDLTELPEKTWWRYNGYDEARGLFVEPEFPFCLPHEKN